MTNFKWEDESEKLWNENAENWASRSENMWKKGSRKDIIPFLSKYFKEGSSIADLGCGDGYGTYLLNELQYQAVGVDLSENMLELAKKNCQNTISFFKSDIASLPFDSDSYDGVMAINSIEWTASPLKTLLEMKRIVKRDGLLCIGILGPTAAPRQNSYNRLYGEEVICNTMMPWEFEQLSHENGFETVDRLYVWKDGIPTSLTEKLSKDLKQSLTFMTVFILKNAKE